MRQIPCKDKVNEMQEVNIKNAKIELLIKDNKVVSMSIQGKNIDIDNTLPLGRGEPDSRFNTMDYKTECTTAYPVEIRIINWS